MTLLVHSNSPHTTNLWRPNTVPAGADPGGGSGRHAPGCGQHAPHCCGGGQEADGLEPGDEVGMAGGQEEGEQEQGGGTLHSGGALGLCLVWHWVCVVSHLGLTGVSLGSHWSLQS